MRYREGSKQEIQNRSSRFYQRDGEWYLQTREGIELGPFETHAEAAVCLDQYIEFVQGTNPAELVKFYKTYAAA